MTSEKPRSIIQIQAILIVALLALSGSANAFSSRGGEGQCADCHSISIQEAEKSLNDLVKEVHGVVLSEVPGFYVIDATGKNGKRGLLYMDYSRNYIISGSFISISDKRNVTKSESYRLRRVDPATIPLEESLIVGSPGAATKVILFTDPQCPYCRKLHPELKKVVQADPDVVFYIKMMPLVNIHPDSVRISKSILCEKSVKLLEDSFAQKKIPDPECDTDAVENTMKLAREIGIASTPTFVLPDGRIVPGYRPAEDILELLNNP